MIRIVMLLHGKQALSQLLGVTDDELRCGCVAWKAGTGLARIFLLCFLRKHQLGLWESCDACHACLSSLCVFSSLCNPLWGNRIQSVDTCTANELCLMLSVGSADMGDGASEQYGHLPLNVVSVLTGTISCN